MNVSGDSVQQSAIYKLTHEELSLLINYKEGQLGFNIGCTCISIALPIITSLSFGEFEVKYPIEFLTIGVLAILLMLIGICLIIKTYIDKKKFKKFYGNIEAKKKLLTYGYEANQFKGEVNSVSDYEILILEMIADQDHNES